MAVIKVDKLRQEVVMHEGEPYTLVAPPLKEAKAFLARISKVSRRLEKCKEDHDADPSMENMDALEDVGMLVMDLMRDATSMCLIHSRPDDCTDAEWEYAMEALTDTPVGHKAAELCAVSRLKQLGKQQMPPSEKTSGTGGTTKSRTKSTASSKK